MDLNQLVNETLPKKKTLSLKINCSNCRSMIAHDFPTLDSGNFGHVFSTITEKFNVICSTCMKKLKNNIVCASNSALKPLIQIRNKSLNGSFFNPESTLKEWEKINECHKTNRDSIGFGINEKSPSARKFQITNYNTRPMTGNAELKINKYFCYKCEKYINSCNMPIILKNCSHTFHKECLSDLCKNKVQKSTKHFTLIASRT